MNSNPSNTAREDELIEEILHRTIGIGYAGTPPHNQTSPKKVVGIPEATAAIMELLREAQANCNDIAEDQPNDVHIHYFNQGFRMGMQKAKRLLEAELSADTTKEEP